MRNELTLSRCQANIWFNYLFQGSKRHPTLSQSKFLSQTTAIDQFSCLFFKKPVAGDVTTFLLKRKWGKVLKTSQDGLSPKKKKKKNPIFPVSPNFVPLRGRDEIILQIKVDLFFAIQSRSIINTATCKVGNQFKGRLLESVFNATANLSRCLTFRFQNLSVKTCLLLLLFSEATSLKRNYVANWKQGT